MSDLVSKEKRPFQRRSPFRADCYMQQVKIKPAKLTSMPWKILRHITCSNIICLLNCINFFKHQHRLRNSFCRHMQLAQIMHNLHTTIKLNHQTDTFFLDFSKAFEWILHWHLLAKFSFLKIHLHIISWIESFVRKHEKYTAANKFQSPLTK